MASPKTAAEQALKKLDEQLTCAICLDDYKDPKFLNCFHVFSPSVCNRWCARGRPCSAPTVASPPCCPRTESSSYKEPSTSTTCLTSDLHSKKSPNRRNHSVTSVDRRRPPISAATVASSSARCAPRFTKRGRSSPHTRSSLSSSSPAMLQSWCHPRSKPCHAPSTRQKSWTSTARSAKR